MQSPPGQPPYGASPPGVVPPAQSKPFPKWAIFLAIGCAGTLVMAFAFIVLAGFGAHRYMERAKAAATPLTCMKAAACCRKVAEEGRTSTQPCEALKTPGIPEATCQKAYDNHLTAGMVKGIACE